MGYCIAPLPHRFLVWPRFIFRAAVSLNHITKHKRIAHQKTACYRGYFRYPGFDQNTGRGFGKTENILTGSGILLLWMVSEIHQNLGTGCRNSSTVCREFGKSYVLEVNKRAFSGVSYESKLQSGRRWLYNWSCQVINRRANSDHRYAPVNKSVRALVSLFLAATDESSSARIACLGVQTDSYPVAFYVFWGWEKIRG